LIEKYLQDITLLTLAFQSEQEWLNIKERQKAGITIAKEKGKPLGRPRVVRTEKEICTVKAWQNGVITLDEAMQKLSLKKSAFYKFANDIKNC
jgi:DNA invertase Pin-like site-specific DNA recombinase